MLRDHGIKVTSCIRWENCAKVVNDEKQSKRENDARDRDSSDPESQAHCWFPRFLR